LFEAVAWKCGELFRGVYAGQRMRKGSAISRHRWAPLIEEYDRFLAAHRGLAPATRKATRSHVCEYLHWQFGCRAVDWSKVRPQNLWRYASYLSRRWKRSSTNHALCSLRSFFRYLHLRGDCPHSFELAVPRVANYAATSDVGVLSATQRRHLLSRCKKKTSAEGLRDYAMILCMLDLGLRRSEVVRLRLSDVDLASAALTVPAVKNGYSRRLPLPSHVKTVLGRYLRRERPASDSDFIFVRHGAHQGEPLLPEMLSGMTGRLYRSCGFPDTRAGTHRLRHTFATRLFSRGATLKQIADLLGHRWVQTSRRYTHLDLKGLRALARPWPI
jgi:integrase/recombinase XerD